MEYTAKEFALAMRVVRLEDALKTANENASKQGMMGVLPDSGGPSFRRARKFYARVRKTIRETH